MMLCRRPRTGMCQPQGGGRAPGASAWLPTIPGCHRAQVQLAFTEHLPFTRPSGCFQMFSDLILVTNKATPTR